MPGRSFDFAVIGINHGHIHGQIDQMRGAGCRLTAFHAVEDDLAAAFQRAYPEARRVAEIDAILDDPAVRLVCGAGIPVDRGPMAIRAMRAGKDVMLDKPGVVTRAQLEALKAAQAETGRILSILYSEHYTQRATVRAVELVREGAIGRVIQTVGLGPHRKGNYGARPDWFWDPARNGAILTDIASHQFEQFLSITGATEARIVASVEENFDTPDHPGFFDYGHAVVASDHATGFIRVDWFTPAGSPAWGDGRLFILGTEGNIELRKYMDTEGRPGGDHLFLTDANGTRYIDCGAVALTYGARLRDDVLDRTATAMPQDHCFRAMELAIAAHELSARLPGARPAGSPA
jgi:predicted dehydrogenase